MGQQSKLKLIPLESLTNLSESYSLALQSSPILVKAITSGLLAALGNFIGQKLQNRRQNNGGDATDFNLNWSSIASYAIFGLGVTGPVTHFYLNLLEQFGPKNSIVKLFFDRFIYGPAFLYLSLHVLSILQGNGVSNTRKYVRNVYCDTLKANLKIWIICQYINLNFVPLEFRTLVSSLISLFWNIYLSASTKSSQQSKRKKNEEK